MQIESLIQDVVSKHLEPARVTRVTVSEDIDHDGDQILRVSVVVELDGDRLDPRKVAGLARHLREPLEKLHEERFPVFTFMRPEELDGAAA